MWVDIANLMGPQGKPGEDGQPGEPGPINIGLNPDEPIRWDQTGGFTFQFVDGSEQTVNLPIASAQSAGLLGAGGGLPSTGVRDVSGLLQNEATGRLSLDRTGVIVTVSIDSIRFPSSASGTWQTLANIPAGFRPKLTLKLALGGPEVSRTAYIRQDGVLACHHDAAYELRNVWTYSTADPWPQSLPGSSV